MGHALQKPLTVPDFLDWEERQAERHELIDGAAVAMVGGTAAHAQVAGNIHVALTLKLRGGPCRAFQQGLKVVADDAVVYPDVLVTCSPLSDRDRIVSEPTVVVEILSESTERRDRIAKNRGYRAIPSIQQYILVAQDALYVESLLRTPQGWLHEPVEGADGVLRLPSLGLELELAEVYAATELLADG